MTRQFRKALDGALEELEELVATGERLGRVGRVLGAIRLRGERNPDGRLGDATIELEEVRPGVYQSVRRTRGEQHLADARALLEALRPEIPDAIVETRSVTRRRR
jgi:hypothetical protein